MSGGRNTQVLKWIRNILFSQCLSTFGVFIIWIPVAVHEYEPALSAHVMLCTFGIMPLMSQAVSLFSNYNIYSSLTIKRNKYWVRGILISAALGLVITGIALETSYKLKYNVDKAIRLKSIHSVTGFMSAILIICAMVTSPLTFICTKFGAGVPPVCFEIIHDLFGQIAYIMGIICLCTGYKTTQFEFYSFQGISTIFIILTIIEVIWPLSSALKSLCQKIEFVTSFTKSPSQEFVVF